MRNGNSRFATTWGQRLLLSARESDATDVSTHTVITATFDEPIDSASVDTTTFYVSDINGKIDGTFSFDEFDVIFTPAAPLREFETEYKITVTTGMTDDSGNRVQSSETVDFTTAIVSAHASYRLRQLRSSMYLGVDENVLFKFPILLEYNAADVGQKWTFRRNENGRYSAVNGDLHNVYKLTGAVDAGGICTMSNTSEPDLQEWTFSNGRFGLNGYEMWLPLARRRRCIDLGHEHDRKVHVESGFESAHVGPRALEPVNRRTLLSSSKRHSAFGDPKTPVFML